MPRLGGGYAEDCENFIVNSVDGAIFMQVGKASQRCVLSWSQFWEGQSAEIAFQHFYIAEVSYIIESIEG